MTLVKNLPTINQIGNFTALSNMMMLDYSDKIGFTTVGAWSLIYNRYQSSQGKDAFWDEEQGDYYAIFTVKDLTRYLGVSDSTVNSILKTLVDEGLLFKKQKDHGFNKANLLFPILPEKYSNVIDWSEQEHEPIPEPKTEEKPASTDTPKSEVSVQKNLVANHLTLTHSSLDPYSFYTQRTAHDQDKTATTKIKKQEASAQQVDASFADLQEANEFEVVKGKLTELGLPSAAVQVLAAFSQNDSHKLEHYRVTLLEAKSDIKNKVLRNHPSVDPASFVIEENTVIQDNILWAIRRAFSYIRKSCKTEEHAKNYFRSVMKGFFEAAGNAFSMGVELKSLGA